MNQPVPSYLLKLVTAVVFVLQLSSFSLFANAGETRPEHFKGLPADTLDEALANFKTYNEKLKAVLAQDRLSAEDMGAIHQMSYTMENALQKMTQEVGKVAEALESVHLGSETADKERVKILGHYYLMQSAKLFGSE